MENELTDIIHPICCTQKIAVYETKSRFYLVGSNNSQTRFRILKIDRTEPTEINIIDDKVEYNNWEIRDVLHRIDVGNRPKSAKYDKGSVGLVHRGSAFGILGFVRFLEGYYVVLISKRRRVALIGGHTIYKVDDVDVIPIANEQAKAKMGNPDETRYLRIFMNVDLSSNFYFSYSYDLTRTLQYNMAPYYGLPLKSSSVEMKDNLSGEAGTEIEDGASPDEISDKIEENVEDSKDIDMEAIFSSRSSSSMELSSLSANVFPNIGSPPPECSPRSKIKTKVFRGTPTDKYVWNSHILEGLKDEVHPDWLLNIIHGFVGQSNICVYGKPLYVTLIARRSKKFAGTRFLKRGTNDEGFVANDVETEQICHDASVISLRSGRYTSYVQIRGSAPFFWSQDTIQGRITPKPQILVDRADPYFTSTGSHFNALMSRYGAPLIILNLVKIKEKKPHEQILSGLLKESIDYLNQFLPFPHKMQYTAWDMARVTKSKEDKVIEILAEIAESKVKETGFFHSGPQLFCNKLRNNPSFADMKGFGYNSEHPGLKQTGILRVNCVDCLDRTNTAQFMVGKCALGFQLYALGVTESPVLQFDSDAVRMLEELFEAHGDTLALQYGGSQMVHRIRTYRKIAPWTSYSRDIMQTVSRYYSNAFTVDILSGFSDKHKHVLLFSCQLIHTDKQQAINLFLGTFQPHEKLPNIWDIPTDYYLHHSSTTNLEQHSVRQSYTKWWHDEVISALPFAWEEIAKKKMIEEEQHSVHDDEETMDLFAEYYRPAEMTEIDGLYQKTMPTSTKDFMPSSSADPSPFVVRARGRTQDDSPQVSHRHAIGGQPVTLEDSSDEESLSDDDRSGMQSPLKINPRDTLTPTDLLGERWPTPRLFRDQIKEPTPDDIELYRRYSEISQSSSPVKPRVNLNLAINWPPSNKYPPNSTLQVEVPVVDKASLSTYEEYCKVGKYGPTYPCNMNMNIYHNYVGQNYM